MKQLTVQVNRKEIENQLTRIQELLDKLQTLHQENQKLLRQNK